jgi:hypothetical protein
MARTKQVTRKGPDRLPSNPYHRFKRRVARVDVARPGWRPRVHKIVGSGLAKVCDDERLKEREERLEVVEIRGSRMPVLPAGLSLDRFSGGMVAFLILGLAVTFCPDFMRGVALVGVPFVAAVFAAAVCLGDVRILQDKTRTEIMFERTAPWLPGETTEERDARRDRACSVLMEQCIPGEIPGKVLSTQTVLPGRKSFAQMADKNRLVVTCDLTDAELTLVRDREGRLDPATERPVALTLEDRMGATLPDLITEYGSRSAVLAKWQEAGIERREAELNPETQWEPNEFDLRVRELTKALPQTVTHTGTGNYFVKVSPTLHNDTQSGPIVGQTVNLTTGGLGVNAFIGGYISNTTRSEIRAIVSNAASSAVLEGSLTNWQDTDVLEVYDAWLLSSLAWAQVFTDQGSATITANQYVRVFAGTYIESNVEPSSGFVTSPVINALPIFEGDPSTARENIILRDDGGSRLILFSSGAHGAIIRHMWLDAKTVTSTGVVMQTVDDGSTVQDCRITTDADKRLAQGWETYTALLDCELSAPNYTSAIMIARITHVERCTFIGGSSTGGSGVSSTFQGTISLQACVLSSFSKAIIGTPQQNAQLDVRNCTFYNLNIAVDASVMATNPLNEFKNCIFQGIADHIFRFHQVSAETADYYGQPFTMQNCYFYDYADFAFVESDTTYYTFGEVSAWGSVTSSGNVDGVNPLLTDPSNGDFSLDTGSPCINTGHGSGVIKGYNGVNFDPNNPDIGGYSTGVLAADPPTWTSNTSNIVATDADSSGEVLLAWNAATPGTGSVGYIVESRTAAGPGAWGEDARTTVNGTVLNPFVVGGLANGVERDFRVKAYSRITGEPTTTPVDTDSATPTAPDVPDAPQITATDLLNQSDVQVDVVASDPADVSTIYYQIRPDGVLQTWGTPVTGSGSETLTGLLVKPYVIYAVATRGGCTGDPSNLVFLTIQAADQYTNIRTALYEWVKGVVGNPTVIWREPNAPQPARPYVSIKMGPTTTVGSDYHSGADTNGIESVEGDREFVFSIQVHGKPADEDKGEAISIKERIQSSLEKRSTQATLCAAGLSRVITEGSGDLAGIGGTEYEARVTTYSDDDDVGYIATVEDPVGTLE